MEAFKVIYKTAGKTDSTIVLVGENESIEEALSKRDSDYSADSRWCRIESRKKIPLSNVKISDLSITEFQMVMSSNK